eukprot:527787-Amphidinium_carterae.1
MASCAACNCSFSPPLFAGVLRLALTAHFQSGGRSGPIAKHPLLCLRSAITTAAMSAWERSNRHHGVEVYSFRTGVLVISFRTPCPSRGVLQKSYFWTKCFCNRFSKTDVQGLATR